MIQASLFSPPPTLEGPRDGETFDAAKDGPRLNRQAQRVFDLMRDGEWRTLAAIAGVVLCSEASASARLRDLRKERFGGHTVERRRDENTPGLWWYRVIVREQS